MNEGQTNGIVNLVNKLEFDLNFVNKNNFGAQLFCQFLKKVSRIFKRFL